MQLSFERMINKYKIPPLYNDGIFYSQLYLE